MGNIRITRTLVWLFTQLPDWKPCLSLPETFLIRSKFLGNLYQPDSIELLNSQRLKANDVAGRYAEHALQPTS
jgi:hypothetical protein